MEISEMNGNHQYLHEILEGQGSIDGWKDHSHEIKESNLIDAGDGGGLPKSMAISDLFFDVLGYSLWL